MKKFLKLLAVIILVSSSSFITYYFTSKHLNSKYLGEINGYVSNCETRIISSQNAIIEILNNSLNNKKIAKENLYLISTYLTNINISNTNYIYILQKYHQNEKYLINGKPSTLNYTTTTYYKDLCSYFFYLYNNNDTLILNEGTTNNFNSAKDIILSVNKLFTKYINKELSTLSYKEQFNKRLLLQQEINHNLNELNNSASSIFKTLNY